MHEPSIMVTHEHRSDEDVLEDVVAELRWNPRIAPTRIDAEIEGGVVTLSGTVESYVKRWAAEGAVLGVRGVRAVVNEIEVRLPKSSERADAEIAEEALRVLDADDVLSDSNIKVTVSSGWVTLTGTVDWNFEREEAERVILAIWGVHGVSNQIAVRARRILADLRRAIEGGMIEEQIEIEEQLGADEQPGKRL
jgi:osmotically-inducible protein OsmY